MYPDLILTNLPRAGIKREASPYNDITEKGIKEMERKRIMARGPRKTIDEKIQAKEELIQSLQIRIKSEQAELTELYREKQAEQLSELSDILSENGLSAMEAAAILREHTRQQQTA